MHRSFLGKVFINLSKLNSQNLYLWLLESVLLGQIMLREKLQKDEYVNSSFDRIIFIINDLEENSYDEINTYGTTVDLFSDTCRILGWDLKEVYFGKSLLSKRNHSENIITPEFHLSENYVDFPKHNSFPSCFTENNNLSSTETNNCTRKRIFTYFDQNLLFYSL